MNLSEPETFKGKKRKKRKKRRKERRGRRRIMKGAPFCIFFRGKG